MHSSESGQHLVTRLDSGFKAILVWVCLVAPCVATAGCWGSGLGSDREAVRIQEKQENNVGCNDITLADCEHVIRAVRAFLIGHKEELCSHGAYGLIEPESLEGPKKRLAFEDMHFWEVGKWTLQGNRDACKALHSRPVAPRETLDLILDLRRSGQGYVVTDWRIRRVLARDR